ncbi:MULTISPECIES: calcium-binding protein [unclassified Francisella]|uniref:calcium-binding protein n=1 Tax=unclassified Francisella TaxID=2610885 RepID=UPI002E346E4B|nr:MULTISPECIES: calcium-binding protein [unclassified Francisella]MED7820292.1 calcium-binding protein [Francisella sp. 19S2-4]MED7831127.1 calcium-binding protein [Francisella sp. 19S2-10]
MRKGEDIHVTFKNSKEDQLIIKDFQNSTIKLFEFSDGTKLNKPDIEIGGDDSDTLVANRNNNILIGGRGDDILKARAGDDTLIGGLGNDIINGQSGNNTIVYNLGDGLDIIKADKISDTNHTDKILFGEGISNEKLNYIRKGKDLFIQVDGNPTQGLLVKKFYKSNKYETKVQSLSFTNGEIIDLSTVQPITFGTDSNDVICAKKGYTNHIDAKDGNDKLKGSDKGDILIGGQGDDILAGGAGSDTYEYSTGDGNDTINLAGGGSTDTLKLNDISKDDILFSRADNDLQINFRDQLSSIIVDDYFESQYNDALIIDANDEFQMQLAANANKMAEILAANVSDDDIDGGSVGGSNQVTTQVDASQLADLWVPKNNDSV